MYLALPQLDISSEPRRTITDYLTVVADQNATISQLRGAVAGLLKIISASSSAEASFGEAGLKAVSQAMKRVCVQATKEPDNKSSESQLSCDCACKDDNAELSMLLMVSMELLYFCVQSWYSDDAGDSRKPVVVELLREHIVRAVSVSWDNESLLVLARHTLMENSAWKHRTWAAEVQCKLKDGIFEPEVRSSHVHVTAVACSNLVLKHASAMRSLETICRLFMKYC
jgi:hypothetical protein